MRLVKARVPSIPNVTVSWGSRQVLQAKDNSAAKEGEVLDRFLGQLDDVKGREVEGWIYSKTNPERTLVVQIYDRQRLLGESDAALYREDLFRAGIGNGRHCFR